MADRIVLRELGRVVRVIDRGAIGVEELQDLIAARAPRDEGRGGLCEAGGAADRAGSCGRNW